MPRRRRRATQYKYICSQAETCQQHYRDNNWPHRVRCSHARPHFRFYIRDPRFHTGDGFRNDFTEDPCTLHRKHRCSQAPWRGYRKYVMVRCEIYEPDRHEKHKKEEAPPPKWERFIWW